jgi:membrane peptidoglycan carboxypeptidase
LRAWSISFTRGANLRIGALLLLICALEACMGGGPGFKASSRGPIQLFDVHGQLICQVHGQNPQLSCLDNGAAPRRAAGYFIDYALRELATDLHVSLAHLPADALNVSTTLDMGLQWQVLQKARQYIASMAATHHLTDAALVMLDYRSGAVRALIGSLSGPGAANSGDYVTQRGRQPGSIFKPIVYANAFEQGISPGEVVYDGPFIVGPAPGYAPSNYDLRYHGYMSYRSALQSNYNIPALKLFVKTGAASLRKTAQALGIRATELGPFDPLYYSMALGTMEMTLLDATAAYGTMANGGTHVPAHALERISAPGGHLIYATRPRGTRALSPQAAFMVTDVMSEHNALVSVYGRCSPFLLYSGTQAQCLAGQPGEARPAAVHEGQDYSFRDSMTIGYTADLVAGAWTGNDDFSLMYNVNALNGAARIWHDSMLLAEAHEPVRQLPGSPAGLIQKTVSYTGLTTTDWYLS